MANPTGPTTSVAAHNLLNSTSVVALAVGLLRDNWEQLSDGDRAEVLDRLGHRADSLVADLTQLVRTGEVHLAYQERIAELETAAGVSRDRIEAIEAAALDSEAAALVSDARIRELAAEVDRLLSARDHATVINQAKASVMRVMHIGEDAAFAVLVAASQRENVDLQTIAERMAASQDESSNH